MTRLRATTFLLIYLSAYRRSFSCGWIARASGSIRGKKSIFPERHARIVEIQEKVIGKEHPDYASSLHKLAAIYEAQLRHTDAEQFYLQAVEISEKMFGQKHLSYASSLSGLADVYESMSR